MLLSNMKEKYVRIHGVDCYGTNNIPVIRLLIKNDHLPVSTDLQDGERFHYFERTEEFDEEVEFYKSMLSGNLFEWMAQMSEKLGDDQMIYDLL